MADNTPLKWLRSELSDWEEAGLISEEQVNAIRAYYNDQPDGESSNVAFIVLGVIAALLVGGGVTLIFANNWSVLNTTLKTVLSIVPLLIGLGLYVFTMMRNRNSVAWVESSSVFLALMLAASMALLSQTYDWLAREEDFLLCWLLLLIPLFYLMNASLVVLMYLIGICSWVLQVGRPDTIYYWLLIVPVLPHLWTNLRKSGELIRKNILEWTTVITFCISWFAVTETRIFEFSGFGVALWMVVFYLMGQQISRRANLFLQPWQLFSIVGIFVMLLVFSWSPDVASFSTADLWQGRGPYPTGMARVNTLVLLFFLIAYLVGVFNFLQKNKDKKWQHWGLLFFPVLALFYALLMRSGQENVALALVNAYALFYGVLFLRDGIQQVSMVSINLGMLCILSLIAARFFDVEWSMVIKGSVFILLGLAFLAVNYQLWKKRKQVNA